MEQMSYKRWLAVFNIEPETEDCDECDGDGDLTCPSCENVTQCICCDGTGETDITEREYRRILQKELDLIQRYTRDNQEGSE